MGQFKGSLLIYGITFRQIHSVEGEAFAVPVISPTSSDIDTLEMKKCDLLIFNNLAFHRSLLNRSDTIRWSVDFRYSRADTLLEGLWHEAIACSVRYRKNKQCPASWHEWQRQWHAIPHKDRFIYWIGWNAYNSLKFD